MNTLVNLFKDKEIIIFCGCGGVGKTTVSSILSFFIASQNKRVALMAIDPAMRLATALGINNSFDSFIPVKVPESDIEIKARMLDPAEMNKRFFERYKHGNSDFSEIVEHPLYSRLMNAATGSPEYLAISELGVIKRKNEFDVIVLDTPPTKQVLDFLHSTRRTIDLFTDKKRLTLFLSPLKNATKFGITIVNLWLNIIGRLLNIKALTGLYEFLELFAKVIDEDSIISESNYIESLLKDKRTAFFVVTSAKDKEIEETIYLSDLLVKNGYKLHGFFINKILPEFKNKSNNKKGKICEKRRNDEFSEIYRKADEKYRDFLFDHDEEDKNIKKLMARFPVLPFFSLPTILSDLHTPKNLFDAAKSIKNLSVQELN